MTLEEKYQELCNIPSDINEHLPILRKYAEQCESICECGVRWTAVSSIAFAVSKPKKYTAIDIDNYEHLFEPYAEEMKNNGTEFKFITGNTLGIEIEPVDLLFIDTYHIYNQLKAELALHSRNAKKWIICHDTETFGRVGENGNFRGLAYAVEEFIDENKYWKIEKIYYNNNGLTILKRK